MNCFIPSLWPIQLLDHHEKCHHLTFLPGTKSKSHLEPTHSSLLTSSCNKIFFLCISQINPFYSSHIWAWRIPTGCYCCNLLKLLAQSPSSLSSSPNGTIKKHQGFPGGAVVGSLPVNAGDTGSSPGPGRSHMPRSNWAHVPQLLSCALEPTSHNYWAHVPQLLKPACLEPMLRNKRSHHHEKPTHPNEE